MPGQQICYKPGKLYNIFTLTSVLLNATLSTKQNFALPITLLKCVCEDYRLCSFNEL